MDGKETEDSFTEGNEANEGFEGTRMFSAKAAPDATQRTLVLHKRGSDALGSYLRPARRYLSPLTCNCLYYEIRFLRVLVWPLDHHHRPGRRRFLVVQRAAAGPAEKQIPFFAGRGLARASAI